jgi:AcrR family transcriptional regulator
LLKSVEKKRARAVQGPRRHPGYRAADRRRAAIIEALRRSMLDQGFSSTSLTDLAKRAGMSVSHFLYYFPDKETVLAELAKSITDETLAYIGGLTQKPPQNQCRELVNFFFGGPSVPLTYRSLVLQTMGVATHDRQLLARQKQQASRFRVYLRQLFRKSPGIPAMKVDDAAAIAAAIWMGLHVNSYFDPGLTMPRAARLMLTAMSWLGNFEDGAVASIANGEARTATRARRTKKPVRTRQTPVSYDGKSAAAFANRRSG